MNSHRFQKIMMGLLAMLLLVSTLAACDEFGRPGNDTKAQETIEIPEGPLDPEDCGLHVFQYFDFTHCFEGGSYGEKLKKDYNYYMSDEFEIEDVLSYEARCFYISNALWKYSKNDGSRKNIEINITNIVNSNWTHKIISTKTDFALVSKAPNGKLYVTGFVDGELKNDAGFIDEKSVPNLNRISEPAIYNAMLDYTRKEFFGQLWEKRDTGNFMILESSMREPGQTIKESSCTIDYFFFYHENGNLIAESSITEDIPEDYINQLLANETIVAVSPDAPVRTWPEEETRKEPTETRYKPPKPTEPEWTEPPVVHPEDVIPEVEEITTLPETEAEVEPPAA